MWSDRKTGIVKARGARATCLFGAGILTLAPLLWSPTASAQTLADAMAMAYTDNPTLQQARSRLRATDEQLPEALAGRYPKLEGSASTQQREINEVGGSGSYDLTTTAIGVGVTQPLYYGGRISARISGAENRIRAARALLLSAEQSVLLSAATAYLDIVRDREILDLYHGYGTVLQERLRIENQRMKTGVNNKTDVSQAESRLARAISDRINADSALQASIAEYVRIIGTEPGALQKPNPAFSLPKSLDEAVEVARTSNPDIEAIRHLETASRNDVDAVDGELLPRVELFASLSHSLHPSILLEQQDSSAIGLQVKIPLDDGSISARARGARQVVSQRMQQIEEERRRVVSLAVKSWNALAAARASANAHEAEIRSIEITLASMRTEVDFGTRTLTDLLDAEMEALNARTALAIARYNETVQAFRLISAVGQLTARNMGLRVKHYDAEAHYNQVRGKIWGVSLPGDPK